MLRSPRELAYLVVIAVAIGFVLSRVAPARGTAPVPTVTPAAASSTPTEPPAAPTDDPRVWDQPLVAGCADAADAYLVSLGGGVARYDGQQWFLIDDTLRRLRAASCVPGVAIAVGDGGRMLRIETGSHTIRPDTLGSGDDDFLAVSALDARTITAVGSSLVLARLSNGSWDWSDVAASELSWRAVLMRSANEVWIAGDKGRLGLFDGTKFVDRSIPDGPDLTTLAALGSETLIGAADGRTFTVDPAHAAAEGVRVKGRVSAIVPIRALAAAYVVSDEITLFGAAQAASAPPPSGLSCPAVGAFGSGRGDLWLIARDAGREGVARYDGGVWTKWGRC